MMAPQTYDELVAKATAEDLISEDWDTNLQICDKVQVEGEAGAKAVVAALLKRLAHRNPNVQIFALELANSLVQNNGKVTHSEISSRAWTGALDRLINDRTTVPEVKKRALKFVKSWTQEFGEDANLGVMKELYVSLEAKKYSFDGPAKPQAEDAAAARLRQEEEELQKVLALSIQDKGGRHAPASSPPSGSSSSRPLASTSTPTPSAVPSTAPKPYPAKPATPPPQVPTKQTASRVRAIYPFVTQEKGELGFERGEVIKVIDRMYDEWYTGAVGGRIGIFPISYVEPLPDPTSEELQKEAQEEARVFAAQGMIVNLQRMLDSLDPTRGDRLDDPALEDMYQKTVALQPQIVALMKKYADQKAELEHIHLGFVKASRQYVRMTQPQPQLQQVPQMQGGQPGPVYGYDQPTHPGMGQRFPSHGSQTGAGNRASYYDPNAAAAAAPAQPYTAPPQAQQAAQPQPQDEATRLAAEQHAAAWAAYYAQQAAAAGSASPEQQGQQKPLPTAEPTAAEKENIAAWQSYYAAIQAQGGQVPAEHQAAVAAAMAHPLIQQGQAGRGAQESPSQPMANPYESTSQPQAQAQPQAQPQQPGYGQSPYGQQPQPQQTQPGGVYQHPAATSHTSLHQQQQGQGGQRGSMYAQQGALGVPQQHGAPQSAYGQYQPPGGLERAISNLSVDGGGR